MNALAYSHIRLLETVGANENELGKIVRDRYQEQSAA